MCSLSTLKLQQVDCLSWQKMETAFRFLALYMETPEVPVLWLREEVCAREDVTCELQDAYTSTVVSSEVKMFPLCAMKPPYAWLSTLLI